MQKPSKELMLQLAGEFESLIPANVDSLPQDAAAAPVIGIFSKLAELVAALKANDWKATMRATRDLLTLLLGEDGSTISFAPGAPLAAIDWKKLSALLLKLLPFILENLGQAQAA